MAIVKLPEGTYMSDAAPDIMAVVAQAVGFEPSGWKLGGYSKTNERYIASLCIPWCPGVLHDDPRRPPDLVKKSPAIE